MDHTINNIDDVYKYAARVAKYKLETDPDSFFKNDPDFNGGGGLISYAIYGNNFPLAKFALKTKEFYYKS
jgi:hypothetical protein